MSSLAPPSRKKCEGDFLSRLGAPQKEAYASELGRYDAKYPTENGSMCRRSFTAFCGAEVSLRYWREG